MIGRSISRGAAIALMAAAFLAIAVATRLPLRDRTLFISDSVRYALAMERYDMTMGRPHPPGNPLYVGLAKTIDAVIGDPATSLALLSALMSGVAFLFAYLLGRDLGGEIAGWMAAGILAVSPLFWFFGAVAMPATGEAALALAIAWLARRARSPVESVSFWWMTALLGLAYGFRSTFAVLMLPLWLFAAFRHPARRIVAGAALLLAAAVAWTSLVASLSGGLAAYRSTTAAFLSEVVLGTKILGGGLAKIPAQARNIAASAVLGLGVFLLPCLAGIYGSLRGRWWPFPSSAPFLTAWALPMLLFHAAYDWAPRFGVLLMAPASVLAAATSIPLAQRLAEGRWSPAAPTLPPSALARALLALGLAVSLALFLLPVQVGPLRLPEPYPSASRLLQRNADLSRRDAAIRSSYDPDRTVILAHDHAFHAAYFLPEYRVVGLFPVFKNAPDNWVPSARDRAFDFEPGSRAIPETNPLTLPPEVSHLVIYDADLLAHWPADAPRLAPFTYDVGHSLSAAAVEAPSCIEYGFRHIRLFPAPPGGCDADRSPSPP